MNILGSILGPTLSTLAKFKYAAIANWKDNAWKCQRHIFQHLIRCGEHTLFGTKHHFSKIISIKDFQNQVPISEYEDVKPYIDQIIQRENNILWNSPISWFAKSSGTTSEKSKFIPISKESLDDNHFQASKDMLYSYHYHAKNSAILHGKSLIIGGSHQISTLNDQIQYGDLSAILMQNSPWLGKWIRTPHLSISLMDEWESKIEQLALHTIKENVTVLAGVPTWTLVLLKKILTLTQKRYINEVWPNLQLYIHGGVNFIPYKEHFQILINKDINYLEVYNASEGFFAAQEYPNDHGLLLFTNHGIFYEFIPLSELKKEKPQTLLLKDVEINKTYALVISTNSGLWRYMPGDTIMFTSLQPYKIIVIGRTKQFINAFGEEVIVDNTDKAIAIACRKSHAILKDYTAGPIYFKIHSHQQAAHEWLIEFDKPPTSLKDFTYDLDQSLQSLNSDYEAKRYKNLALQEPIISILPQGTFEQWLKHKGKLGGQHKIPRLSNNREYIDDIKNWYHHKQ